MFRLPTVLSVCVLAANISIANSTSNDFGQYTGELTPLSAQEIRARLQVRGDLYVVDGSGNKLLFRAPETRQWTYPTNGQIESNWSAQIADYPAIALRHVWTVGDDGVLRVKFQQFESMKRSSKDHVRYGKLLKEEEKIVTDFAQVTWTAFSDSKYKLILRFTPILRDISNSQEITDLPIAGTQVLISDNQGRTWTEPMEHLKDKYIAFITHRGELALSYHPFAGSNIVGRAKGNLIEVEVEKGFTVRLTSASPFLPGDVTSKVYALYRADRRSPRITSTHVLGSGKENDFIKKLNSHSADDSK